MVNKIIVTQLRFFLEGLVLGAVQEEGLHSPSMESLTGATEKHGGEKFDPSTFVTSLRFAESIHQESPLDEIQGSLRRKLADLKKSLYRLINDDYAKFMALAIGLQGMDDKVESLHTSLADFANSLNFLKCVSQRERQSIEKSLRERQILERKRRSLQRSIVVVRKMNEVQSILRIMSSFENIGSGEDNFETFTSMSNEKDGNGHILDNHSIILRNPKLLSCLQLKTLKGLRSEFMCNLNNHNYAQTNIDNGGREAKTFVHLSSFFSSSNSYEHCAKLERLAHSSLALLAALRSHDAAGALAIEQLAVQAKILHREVLSQLNAAFVQLVLPPDNLHIASDRWHQMNPAALVPCLRAMAALERCSEGEKGVCCLL